MLLNRHLIFLYVALVVSVGYFITALSLGAPTSEEGLTPSFFPIFVGAAAIVFAGILIVQKLRSEPEVAHPSEPATYTHLWVLAAIFAYIMVFKSVGYFLSSGIFVFALIVIFSSFEKLLIKAAISAAIVLIVYLMFQQLFGVRLPTLWS